MNLDDGCSISNRAAARRLRRAVRRRRRFAGHGPGWPVLSSFRDASSRRSTCAVLPPPRLCVPSTNGSIRKPGDAHDAIPCRRLRRSGACAEASRCHPSFRGAKAKLHFGACRVEDWTIARAIAPRPRRSSIAPRSSGVVVSWKRIPVPSRVAVRVRLRSALHIRRSPTLWRWNVWRRPHAATPWSATTQVPAKNGRFATMGFVGRDAIPANSFAVKGAAAPARCSKDRGEGLRADWAPRGRWVEARHRVRESCQ